MSNNKNKLRAELNNLYGGPGKPNCNSVAARTRSKTSQN